MGAHTWVRDEKRGGGKTYASGAVAAPQPETKKRKLIWTRAPSDGTPSSQEAAPSSEKRLNNGTTHRVPAKQKQPTGLFNQQNALPEKDIAALRRKIEERQQRLLQSAATSASACIDAEHAAAANREERKRKLEAGFLDALAAAKETAAADILASRAHLFADEAEVQRVLKAASDYGVMQLAPGTSAALIRRRYREMAVRLHPDKCNVQGASDAFQRLVKAHQQLTKYTQ